MFKTCQSSNSRRLADKAWPNLPRLRGGMRGYWCLHSSSGAGDGDGGCDSHRFLGLCDYHLYTIHLINVNYQHGYICAYVYNIYIGGADAYIYILHSYTWLYIKRLVFEDVFFQWFFKVDTDDRNPSLRFRSSSHSLCFDAWSPMRTPRPVLENMDPWWSTWIPIVINGSCLIPNISNVGSNWLFIYIL